MLVPGTWAVPGSSLSKQRSARPGLAVSQRKSCGQLLHDVSGLALVKRPQQHMQLARTLRGAKAPTPGARTGTCSPEATCAENNRPPSSPGQSSASAMPSSSTSAASAPPSPVQLLCMPAAGRPIRACTWRPRRDGDGRAAPAKKGRPRDPVAQSDVDAKRRKPDHPTGPYAAGHDSGWR